MVRGGAVVPDTAKERPQEGEVLAVGVIDDPINRTPVALEVKVGDRILFGKHAGQRIEVGVEELVILGEDDHLVVLA
jgi:chaperonin GroES